MSNVDALKQTAINLISKFGDAAVYVSKANGAYDNSTLKNTVTTTNYNCTAAIFDYKLSNIDNVTVKRGDCYALVADLSIEPKVNDSVSINSKNWSVVDVKTVYLSGSAVLYKLQVRL